MHFAVKCFNNDKIIKLDERNKVHSDIFNISISENQAAGKYLLFYKRKTFWQVRFVICPVWIYKHYFLMHRRRQFRDERDAYQW